MPERNLKKINSIIFSRLEDRVINLNGFLNNFRKPRWIKSTKECQDVMKYADCEVFSVSRNFKIIKTTHKGKVYYIVFSDFSDFDGVEIEGMDDIQLTSGYFCLAASESNISTMAKAFEIKDKIELFFKDEDVETSSYHGHELEDIKKLFPNCKMFLLLNDNVLLEDFNRAVGIINCKLLDNSPLHLEGASIKKLEEIFLQGNEFIPYINIIHGMNSLSWESFYLQLYRCIEQLYAQHRVDLLKTQLAILNKESIKDIATYLEKSLSWRPKEEESIQELFTKTSSIHIKELGFALGIIKYENNEYTFNGSSESDASKPVAREAYQLRNNIVHFRPLNMSKKYDDQAWNILIRAMLGIIKDLYEDIGPRFFNNKI